MAHLLKYFERESEGIAYAPRYGGSYDQSDVFATVYERLAQVCKQRSELVNLRAKYPNPGNHQLRVRDRAVARMLGEQHDNLRKTTAELEESCRIPERRLHEMLEEIRKTREAAQDLSGIDTDPAAQQRLAEKWRRAKIHFVEAIGLPEEILNSGWIQRFRDFINTGTSTVAASTFTTTFRECPAIINRSLGIDPGRSSWSFLEVSNAIERLRSEAVAKQEELKRTTDELKAVQRKRDELEKARVESEGQQKLHDAAMTNMQDRLADANTETESWKRRVDDLEGQLKSTKEAHVIVEDRARTLQSDFDRQTQELQSLRQSVAPAQLNMADQLVAAKQKLSRIESELENSKLHSELEEQKNLDLMQASAKFKDQIAALHQTIKTKEDQIRNDKARWVRLIQELTTTLGTDHIISEDIVAPMLVVAQQGTGAVELSSDMLDFGSPSHQQSFAVDEYRDFSESIDDTFNPTRMLKVFVSLSVNTDDMIWIETCVVPKVTKEMGASNGKPSIYALLLYPALQNKLLIANGLSMAIAASALVEVYSHFPFKEDSEWIKYLQAVIPADFNLETLSLVERAAVAKLVTTLADSEDLMQDLVNDHPIGAAVLEGKLYANQSIPDIMQVLWAMDLKVGIADGVRQLFIEEGGRRLIVVDNGMEECIFVHHHLTSWSCCTTGFDVSTDVEGIAVRCDASGDHAWRSSQLIDYTQESPRYAAATAKASYESMKQKSDPVLERLRAIKLRYDE